MFLFLESHVLKEQQSFIDELRKEKLNAGNSMIKINMHKQKCEIREIVRLFSLRNSVQAITLGGSRATGKADVKSDYDIYIYLKSHIGNHVRKNILSQYCKHLEIGNTYWEHEDNCILHNGISVDIVYRHADKFVKNIAGVVENGKSHCGYTTSLWHNVITSNIVYDKNDYLMNVKKRFSVPYPEKLKANIIKKNMALLTDSVVSYDKQIHKSIVRKDFVNMQNRITQFLNSYFDIIFALNEVHNPGEKHIIKTCREKCMLLPNDFEENIELLFNCMSSDLQKIENIIENIIYELKCIVNSSD